jgi:hypothetical protein
MIALEVGDYLKLKEKCGFVTIPAPGDTSKSKGSVLQNLFSIGTQVERPE